MSYGLVYGLAPIVVGELAATKTTHAAADAMRQSAGSNGMPRSCPDACRRRCTGYAAARLRPHGPHAADPGAVGQPTIGP